MYLAMVSSLFAGSHNSHSHLRTHTLVENISANIPLYISYSSFKLGDILEYKGLLSDSLSHSLLSLLSLIFTAGEDPMLSDQQQYRYMTVDDMKSMGDDSMRVNVTDDERDNRHSGGK